MRQSIDYSDGMLYLEKSSLTRLSRQSLSKLRKPKTSPWCISPAKMRYIVWNGSVDARSMGNHRCVTYLKITIT